MDARLSTGEEQDLKERIVELLAQRKYESNLDLALKLGIDEAEFVRHLPEGVRELPSARFEAVAEEISGWGTVLVVASGENFIFEVRTTFPEGRHGYGYFNLIDDGCPLEGHLRVSNLASIFAVEQRFGDMMTYSVQFFDTSGKSMFKVYLDGVEQIPPDQIARFRRLGSEP